MNIWGTKKPDSLPGVKTADQQIQELKGLAAKAAQASPDGRQRVANELSQHLQHEEDPMVRVELIRTLAVYPTPQSAAMLTAGLSDADPAVRIACCNVWGRTKGKDAIKELGRVLGSDTNVDVRLAAARALGQTGDPAAVAPLGDALADSDPAIQFRTIESLKKISGRDYGSDTRAWQQFAKGEPVDHKEPSLAERVRKWF